MAKIVLVGGGSASGKTYVIDQVIEKLGSDNITHFSIDDYLLINLLMIMLHIIVQKKLFM